MAKQTITAFYDTREYANNAALMLRQAGIPDADVTVSPESSTTVSYDDTDRPAKGFWASLEDMFGGSADHETYAEGLRRGGVMVVAHVDDAHVDDAIRILEQHGSVDMDERESTWRNDGWTGATAVTGGGVADTGAGPLRSMSPVSDPTPVTAVKPVAATTNDRTVASTATSPRTGADDVLQVVEETLEVGKRAVNRGKVRIHSYVVETPVSETVNLRDETVSIDRRPVDRALGVGELGADPFKDRTIEMDEMKEEAVVAKSARVVEEIGISKAVNDRVQAVTDTVRSTKVDIDDGRTIGTQANVVGGATTAIADGMDVVGSDGTHVGVVDHVDGATIKLKKMDPASGGSHHLIPTDWVKTVDQKVTLKTAAADVMSRWTAA
ncbi:DUF2382 domain-containing protein [Lichenihabitans sp. PAMC28606]|uniref:DUF2171 domain-containing protein n=1 Tax=Lichenihabitans sp. PAMC28606 TaxID=2880932 RepID=UPI001D09C20C|nr:DUF2382 domain-containing protein [Lichenihabitans sp. PAMC28606]UDL95252.1 DUF2382 domain-containing protein [Lichenihabitans sp. PAMC28606]